jgi:predicted amidohydrolase
MKNMKIAAVQFEHKSLDKTYNLGVIDRICEQAAKAGANVVSFHECCISGYTIAKSLSKKEMLDLAEPLPGGDSIKALTGIAGKYGITLLAGLFEKDGDDNIYNTYACVNKAGMIASFRKLHPFIHPDLKPGNEYCVFDIDGWTCGILICYDNNIIENVRATNLLGADIIFMPHVTMCTPSTRTGAGFVDPKLWENRDQDPTSLRIEFDGMKGRRWLMKWLPARAYDNAAYIVFSNPIGMDADQLKNGCSMIIDPFGDIIAECRKLGDDFAMATITRQKLTDAGGYRYKKARRPELYEEIISQPHKSDQKVAWLNKE